jgi:uncharacterized membrane protein YqjE
VNDTRPGAAAGAGLLVSLRRLVGTAFELAQVRLELIGTELEEQKLRVLAALIWAAIGMVLVGVGLALLAGCVVLLFWDGYRVHAMVALTLVFVAGGAFALRQATVRLKTPPGAFAASAAELAQDRASLEPPGGTEPRSP